MKIDWDKDRLWNGCILAGLAHAIMVAIYPNIANEQSWDGLNYSVQDSSGQRGTISFKDEYCVAAFRNDNSDRISKKIGAENYFKGASEEIIELANMEALQYLLDEVDGETKPFITTAFWGKEELYTNDSFENMLVNGGTLLQYQTMDIEKAIDMWKAFYNMNEGQVQLLQTLHKRKANKFNESFVLTAEEVKRIGTGDEVGLTESKTSFEELEIYWCK